MRRDRARGVSYSSYWEPSSASAGIQGVCRWLWRRLGQAVCECACVRACRRGVESLEPRGPCLTSKENHLFITRMLRYGGARLVGPPRAVKHRRSALGFAQVFATTDHDFPFPPAGGSDVQHGSWPDRREKGTKREGGSREMSAARTDHRNQNEPTGMISSRLNAGFKFVSDSVIDSVSDPAHKLSHERTVGGCARLGCKHLSPVQPYPLTPPSPPSWRSRAPALPLVPSAHDPLRGFDLRLTCDGSRSRLPRRARQRWLRCLLQQSMPVSLGAFVCLHLIIPKSQKRRGCRCQSWVERKIAPPSNSSTGSHSIFLSSHFFLFCLFNLHQQVCYSSSNAEFFILSNIIHLFHCNIFLFLSLGGIGKQAEQTRCVQQLEPSSPRPCWLWPTPRALSSRRSVTLGLVPVFKV